MKWWDEASFGMFIHWGLYAQAAGAWNGKQIGGYGEWIQSSAKISTPDYKKMAEKFNPTSFDAREWVRIAKEAGMKYIVITAKHHDGFAMWNSKSDDYNIVKCTPFKRDPLKELAEACREGGLKLGFYYSQNLDFQNLYARGNGWESDHNREGADFPRYMREKALPQIKELLTEYGDVAVIWWDMPCIASKEQLQQEGETFRNYAWQLAPNILQNNRAGGKGGDFDTPEQSIPAEIIANPWETCMTLNDTWGFKKQDHEWKSSVQVIRNLVNIASKGGNFLLNVGPDETGKIPAASVDILHDAGKWLKVNGESIYAVQRSPFGTMPWGRATMKQDTLYLHITDWPADGKITVPIRNKVSKARILGDTKADVSATTRENNLEITLPSGGPLDPAVTVVALTLDGAIIPGTLAGNRLTNPGFEGADAKKGWSEYGRNWRFVTNDKAVDGKVSAEAFVKPGDQNGLNILQQSVIVFPGQTVNVSGHVRAIQAPNVEAMLELQFSDTQGNSLQLLRSESLKGENANAQLSLKNIMVPAKAAVAVLKCTTIRKDKDVPNEQMVRFDNLSMEVSGNADPQAGRRLSNPGFDDSIDFNGWMKIGKQWAIETTPSGKVASATFESGSQDSFCLLSQSLPVEAGQTVSASAVATIPSGVNLDAIVEVEFNNANDKSLGLLRSRVHRGTDGPSPTALRLDKLVAPAHAKVAKIKCTVLRNGELTTAQSVSFDDVKAEILDVK